MKKILALILALLMTMTVFAGCVIDEDSIKVTESTYDEVEQPGIVLSIDAFNDADGNGYDLEYTEFGESVTVSAIEIGIYEGGKTVGEYFDEEGYEDLKLIDEDDEDFLGWMEYEITVKVDEEDVPYYTYKRTGDEFYTTEEVLNKVMPDRNRGYIAKWKDTPQEDYDYIESIE